MNCQPSDAAAVHTTRRARRLFRNAWVIPYLLPALGLIGFVFGYPLFKVFEYSFQDAPDQIGAHLTTLNYSLLFQDPTLGQTVKHNLVLMLAVPILCTLALLYAILIFERTRGWRFYRSLLFTPYVLAIPVAGITFTYIYALHGSLNAMLRGVGLRGAQHEWLGEPRFALVAILGVIVWKEFGFGLLLFSARLSSADQELFEAARVDGANWFQLQRHITIPQLGRVIEFFVITEAITMLSWVFGYVYTMTRGGPGFATYVMEYLIYVQGFVSQNLGIAAAAAVLLLGGAVALVLLAAALRRRIPET